MTYNAPMTKNEMMRKAATRKESKGTLFAYMVLRDNGSLKAGQIFFDYYESDDGKTVQYRDPSGAAMASFKIGKEAVKVMRVRKQVVTETYKLA